MKCLIPGMRHLGNGSIINVSSRNALSSSPKTATFDASKSAMLALTRSTAMELGSDNIRVNAVCPGVVKTPPVMQYLEDPDFEKNYNKLIPLNRLGESSEIANVIHFLASPESSFITGQHIVVDGGQIAGQNYSRIFEES